MLSSVLIFAGTFIVWAVVHSMLAGLTFKNWLRDWTGADIDRWYRLAYSIFAVITIMPMAVMLLLLPDRMLYSVPAPWRWPMVAGQVLGLAGMAVTLLQTGLFQFIGLTPLFASDPKESGPLQVSGFYCWVRHPMYSFALLVLWLTPEMTVNLLTAYILVTSYLYVGSVFEERKLVLEFGDVYQDYLDQVPRLVPRPGRCYTPPKP